MSKPLNRALSGIFLILGIALLFIWSDPHMREDFFGSDGFQLNRITFYDATGNAFEIPEGYTGYIVFYGTYSDCSSCMRRLRFLKQLQMAYEEVGFFAILRGHLDASDFFNQMVAYEVPGTYLKDEVQVLHKQLNLSNHPKLLLFNRNQKLIGMLPLDIENEGLLKDLHRMIGEM
jgi:hypothetical protein